LSSKYGKIQMDLMIYRLLLHHRLIENYVFSYTGLI